MKTHNLLLASLSFLFVLQGCSKSDSENENDAKNDIEKLESSDYIYFVSGKMNGEEFIFGQKERDTDLKFQLVKSSPLVDALCAYSRDNGTDASVSYSTTIYPNFDDEETQPSFSINFERFNKCSESQDFNSLFPIDNYEFAYDGESTGTIRQMGIGYSPTALGDAYYSSYGKDQSNSTIKITSSEEYNSLFGPSQLVEGEFSVILYGSEDSDTIEITEGKFKLTVSD